MFKIKMVSRDLVWMMILMQTPVGTSREQNRLRVDDTHNVDLLVNSKEVHVYNFQVNPRRIVDYNYKTEL